RRQVPFLDPVRAGLWPQRLARRHPPERHPGLRRRTPGTPLSDAAVPQRGTPMNKLLRATATSLLAASLLVVLGACKKIEPDADKAAATGDDATAAALDIPGLRTEKQQAGYAIGLQIGSTLAEVKDEVEFDALVKAMRTSMDGGEP